MIKITAEDPSLHDLKIGDIQRYLVKFGWTQQQQQNTRMIIFNSPENLLDERHFTIILPTNKVFFDAYDLIARAINLLAAIERSSPLTIVQKMRESNHDTIHVRMLLGSEKSIPSLDAASLIIHGLRNLIAYAACMEKKPKRFFEEILKEGRQQVENFLFGHTYPGSFGFTVEAPIDLPPATQLSLQGIEHHEFDLPLERKITERITRGLLIVQDAIQNQDVSKIGERFEIGFNANMCSAFVEMLKGSSGSEIEYSVIWSSLLEPSPDIINFTSVRLEANISSYLEDAAQGMKSIDKAEELVENASISGEIQGIQTVSRDSVNVKIRSDDHGSIFFFVTKGSQAYQTACNAYRDQRPIKTRGTLTKEGKKKRKSWTLINIQDFNELPDPTGPH